MLKSGLAEEFMERSSGNDINHDTDIVFLLLYCDALADGEAKRQQRLRPASAAVSKGAF